MSIDLYPINPEAQLRPPIDFEAGQAVNAHKLNPEQFELIDGLIPRKIEQFQIADPHTDYLEAIRPGTVGSIQRQERVMNGFAHLRYKMGSWRRKEATTIAYEQSTAPPNTDVDLDTTESVANGDKDAHRKYFSPEGVLGDAALVAWQGTIPSAISLMPLTNPMNIRRIADKHGLENDTTEKTQDWLTACTDGQEIRNRKTIMIDKISSFLSEYSVTHIDEQLTVVSVAGGTALSTMQAIVKSGMPNVRLLLLEGDENSARLSRNLADQIGFTGELEIRKVDVFSPTGMQEVADDLEATGQKAAVADAVGIIEYASAKLRTEARVRRYGEDYHLYNPEKFIASVMNLVADDGMGIIGQMRADRPTPYFTRGVVCWPTICMRSVKRFAEVIDGAGVDMQSTEFSLTPLGVYTMAMIYNSPELKEGTVDGSGATVSTLAAQRLLRSQRSAKPIGSMLTGEVVS